MGSDSPEAKARENIDKQLIDAGWIVESRDEADISAGRGVAIREFPMKSGFGEADYLLYVDGRAVGVVEAKKEGSTLTGFEIQTAKYSEGLPDSLPAPRRPLPFCYQSTGIETRFTNLLEPDAASRNVFSFHRPETLAEWLTDELNHPGSTVKALIRDMPPLVEQGLRPAQIKAIKNLELSLGQGKRRALIQMASGGGKTFTACNFIYRLIKHGGAHRILFLVDRANLGRQTLKEFQNFRTPEEQRLFTELYNVQHLQSNKLDRVSKVCISTIQRLYSMLQRQEELDPGLEEQAGFTLETLQREPPPVTYNPNIPIETFDFIVTDECHRSIYNLWRQVLEYFDASIIGLTATPSKQTLGFFNQNLIMEYNFEQAVADGVNVDFDLYTIRTLISEHGSTINAGFYVDFRDRETRRVRFAKADQDIQYNADELDRRVVARDQIRTIIRTFKDRLFTEIFPGRTDVPKTLIFAKDDSHAEDIVQVVREEFGKGNDFAQKITYRTGTARVTAKKQKEDGTEYEEVTWVNSGIKAEDLLSSFRNSYYPRIAVTVDMIATGTDIRPLEIVFFMRTVKSRTLFEQMKGRGARVVTETELKQVTPDASAKDRFVIIDAIGIDPNEMNETKPLERKRNVSLEKLLELVAFGNRETDVLSSIASRLARLDRQLSQEDRAEIEKIAGEPVASIANRIVQALDPDEQVKAAQKSSGKEEPTPEEIAKLSQALLTQAAQPIAKNPKLRQRLVDLKKSFEQIIDTLSIDELLMAGVSQDGRDRAANLVKSFEKFIEDNRDEITALQILYSRPYTQRLTHEQLKELARAIERPQQPGIAPMMPERVWQAYEVLDKSKVRGSATKLMTDLVSLVRYAVHQENELRPFKDVVFARFEKWLADQEKQKRKFTDEQKQWLTAIRDHIAASVSIEPDDFELPPFSQWGGLGKAHKVFGADLQPILEQLNEVLAA
jgi:type I restriction enzyme R subunit